MFRSVLPFAGMLYNYLDLNVGVWLFKLLFPI